MKLSLQAVILIKDQLGENILSYITKGNVSCEFFIDILYQVEEVVFCI